MKYILTFLLMWSVPCYALKWQEVTTSWNDVNCWRLEVPHGWLVTSRISTGSSLVFYPDEKHEWKI